MGDRKASILPVMGDPKFRGTTYRRIAPDPFHEGLSYMDKKLDSPEVREAEAFLAIERDMLHVEMLLNRLDSIFDNAPAPVLGDDGLERRDLSDDRLLLAKALWDWCLVAVFRHLKQTPLASVRKVYEAAIDRTESANPDSYVAFSEVFDRWEANRDRRITHPVSQGEGFSIVLDLDAEGSRHLEHRIWSSYGPGPDRELMRSFCGIMNTLADSHLQGLLKTIQLGVDTMSDQEVRRLPDYRIASSDRRLGA